MGAQPSGMSQPPVEPSTTFRDGHTTGGSVRGRQDARRGGLGCPRPSGRCLGAGPVVGPRPPPCGLGPGWAPLPTRGERPSSRFGRGACIRCVRVRRAGRHWWQVVRGQGHMGPPHFFRRRPESARPEVELHRGASFRGGQGAQAPRALQHGPPIGVPVPPFRGMAVRSAGRRVQQVQATSGQFVDELGVEGSAPRTWALSRRGRRWARVGLHVAAPSQGECRPQEGFRGSFPSPWEFPGVASLSVGITPPPTSHGVILRASGGLGSG